MTGVFLRLFVWGFRNRVSTRLRRLRQPRYLLGLAAGLAYLYVFILRQQFRAVRRGDFTADPQFAAIVPAVLVVGGLILWVVSLAAWFWPSSQPAIRFTRAEVQFFFTAPVTRRQVINYKLLRSQFGIVFGLLIASIFSGAAVSGRVWFVLGGWVLFATIKLHLIGVAFTRASLSEMSRRPTPAALLPVGVIAAIALTLVGVLAWNLPLLVKLSFGGIVQKVITLGTSGPAAVALLPFKRLIEPALATSARDFVSTAAPAAILLALNYWWVLRSDANLEEAAIAAERQRASGSRRAPEPALRRAPFALAPRGRAEVAILWKNLILLGRYASPRVLLRILLPTLFVASLGGVLGVGSGFGVVALVVAGGAALLGPTMTRNDLRLDMTRLPVLKTWPIDGATLLRGELLAPAAVVSVVVWASLAVALALSGGSVLGRLAPLDRFWAASAAAVAAPAFVLAQLAIQNGAVVIFPGWIPTGASRPRGVEAMGQQLLMLAGTAIVLAVCVLPAAAVAVAAGVVLSLAVGYAALVPAALLFSAALLAEVFVATHLLGRVLDTTDPAQVEAVES